MPALIIDTDPGVDDAFAIALAALDPHVELLGVTTVYGNVPVEATTRNAQRILALCGAGGVPVAKGAERPLVHPHPHRARYAHGTDGLSGRSDVLPEPLSPIAGIGAVELMVSLLRQADEPVVLAPIGPLTNIALLLAAYPEIKPQIDRIVIMGGAVDGGNVTARAEFNLWSDPEAARRVLTEPGVRCVLVPMDLTYQCAVDVPWLDELAASGPIGAALRELTTDYLDHYTKALGRPAVVMHDAIAVAEAIWPGTLRTKAFPLDIECGFGPARGALITDRRRRELIAETAPTDTEPVAVALDIASESGFDGLRRRLLGGLAQSR